MADYIRRLVSRDRARFRDGKLNLELDLVYLTDQVIIMGFPATGIEGLYRNRREDAKKFLETRHGKNFWIFNFCPIRENSYDASFFDGRVSRFPFPDHHAPPLAIMPLVAREMRAWLQGSPERVAVLHCKAGKGRSGTMACAYLLSLEDDPSPPRLERSYSAEEWAQLRAEKTMEVVPEDEDEEPGEALASTPPPPEETEAPSTPKRAASPTASSGTASSTAAFPRALKAVLDLHTSRRMKTPSSPGKKARQGVSIPSQRRWLYYWALLLAHTGPAHFWPALEPGAQRPRVRLTQVRLRMHEATGAKAGLVRAANAVLERARGTRGEAHVWVSLARYDDEFVGVLEMWERHTRDDRHMGVRRPGSEYMGQEKLSTVFQSGKWDREKMVRSFARMGMVGEEAVTKHEVNGQKLQLYTLQPLSTQKWDAIRSEVRQEPGERHDLDEAEVPGSENSSIEDLTQGAKERGIVLDAGREVRVKLYMGQVFMAWLWFIPAFHMTPSSGPTTFRLTQGELDFPLGLGTAIIDVEVELEWLSPADAERVQPPVMARAEEKEALVEDPPEAEEG
ncbi:hypothetical protein LshimejAT787_0602850 [Lyophyllum shimeji]|uniref:phosphatidylinositol-3,4,5-trisphosphate 3-phosphatase n=1 Tax=Lyophyllum shimeji TaxID=47721 RepID=A0A9P3PPD5_LYOSH|nr:hypothetical protein LshimejAT787_0602850 [Lyophyllum shimeji]